MNPNASKEWDAAMGGMEQNVEKGKKKHKVTIGGWIAWNTLASGNNFVYCRSKALNE